MGLFGYFMKMESIKIVLIFTGVVIFNHFLLVVGVDKLFNNKTKLDKIISTVCLVSKITFLIGIFIYVMQTIPEKIAFLMAIFIFQLIILILSIKRNIKLN